MLENRLNYSYNYLENLNMWKKVFFSEEKQVFSIFWEECTIENQEENLR